MYGSGLSIKKNLNYIRTILSLCLILLGFYNLDFTIKHYNESITYFLFIILSNIVLLYSKPFFFKNIKFHYIIFLMDISLIIIGITLFTSIDTPFIIAIFLSIFMAALSKSSGLSLLIAIVVNAVYIYIKTGYEIRLEILNESFLLNLPFIFIVALHSTYLAEKVDEEFKEKLQLEKINKFLTKKSRTINEEFSSYTEFVEKIINNLNEGIIFIDNDGIIKIFSLKCEEIFKIKENRIIDRPLNESKLPEEIIKIILDLKFKNQIVKENMLHIKTGGYEKFLLISANFIKAENDENVGIICEIKEEKR